MLITVHPDKYTVDVWSYRDEETRSDPNEQDCLKGSDREEVELETNQIVLILESIV